MSEPANASAPLNVLFLCTGNSARSILAEAMTHYAPIAGGKFRAFSAGSHPKGTVDPLAIEFLQQSRIPTEGLRSKDWSEFAAARRSTSRLPGSSGTFANTKDRRR